MEQIVNTRKFSVSPAIIYSLIKAQAGTLAKGLLECVMNSVDAGATKIDIEVSSTSLRVVDNGHGFGTRADIEACFEVFGFEHKEGDRQYGQFGIGRAQLWNFCSTIWHTNQFRMDVDIKHRGLDYELVENVGPVQGLVIEGTFYEPLPTSELMHTERELKELAMYVSVPVTFNGKLLSVDPAAQKWSVENDDAWIQLSSTAKTLTVYNLGVKVRDYPAYHFGSGGLVVTKPGVRLSLNMARNDIVLTECKVWKRIRPFLQKKADEAVRRSTRLTEEQLSNLSTRFMDGELSLEEVDERRLIVDVLGRKHTIQGFLRSAERTVDKCVTFANKNAQNPVTEKAHQSGHCFVLGPQTISRFGCRTATEFMNKLGERLTSNRWLHLLWQQLVVEEDWTKACRRIADGYTEIAYKELTAHEQAALEASRRIGPLLVAALNVAGIVECRAVPREVRAGVSECAEAWTDGTNLIWVERRQLKLLNEGLPGAWKYICLLVHEMLHEDASTGTHAHDQEFFERFHAVCLATPGRRGSLGEMAQSLMRLYAQMCRSRNVAVRAKVVESTDLAEKYVVAA